MIKNSIKTHVQVQPGRNFLKKINIYILVQLLIDFFYTIKVQLQVHITITNTILYVRNIVKTVKA